MNLKNPLFFLSYFKDKNRQNKMRNFQENKVEVDHLFALVNQIDSLPTLSDVVQKLMLNLYDSNTNSEVLAKSLSSDTALVSKILKLVNSAYYGFPKKISTISQAIVFLGFNSLKNIVLTASVFNSFDGNGKTGSYDRKRFWEHSLACAVMSKILSKHVRAGLPEEAFIAGLVHDIGKIVIDQYVHDKFVQIIKYIDQNNVEFQTAEQEILGTNHSEIGNWLCEKWNFPAIFLDSIYYHHSPENSTSNKTLVTIVYLANNWAKLEGFGIPSAERKAPLDNRYLDFLNISEDEMLELKGDFYEDYKKANIFLELAK
jgi:HD-like signal output (HDOD) protein